MARCMKEVRAPKGPTNVLVIAVDPLRAPRGHRALPRGGAHRTARRPTRAQSKRELARRLAERSASGRDRAA